MQKRFQFEMDFTDVRRFKSDDDYKNWRGCRGKVQHLTRASAESVMKKMADVQNFNVYECSGCGAWHLGHKKGAR